MEKVLDIIIVVLIILTFIGWFIESETLYTISALAMGIFGIVYYFKCILTNRPSENNPKENIR